MKISDLKSAVEYLKSFISYEDIVLRKYDESKFDLKRFRDFLSRSGVRYDKLRVIHVAGSKGKGTTASLVSQYLERQGYKVGLFTSPYIIDITEGISVNGESIPEAKFLRYVNDLKKFIDESGYVGKVATNTGQMVTYFELLTLIMFRYFLDMKVDFAVLEVGLGGRLDSTNVCHPVSTVLTSVEKEHTNLLGKTYKKILNEKLGIVKRGVPLIIASQKLVVEREIRRRGLGVKVVWAEREGRGREVCERDGCEGRGGFFDPNFEVARACLEDLASRGLIGKFDEKILLSEWRRLKVPGRFEVRKFKRVGVGERVVVLDIAHTIGSAKYLSRKLCAGFPNKRFVFLISMMRDKDVSGFLSGLVCEKDEVVFTSSHPVRGYSGEQLRREFHKSAKVEERPVVAFKSALKKLKSDQVLVVTGSHFLVGKILESLNDR